jgi:HK97 family phage major capsid protein
MTDTYNFTRLGQANLSGDVAALFKDQFIPELLTAFDAKRVMKNYVRSKTINKGKSASFPVLGTTSAQYVSVGDTLLGNQTIAHNEITINLDPFLVSDILIPELDVKMQEYDDRSEIVEEMSRALANTEDKQLLQVGVLAARGSAIVTGGNGGSVINAGASVLTSGETLAAAIYTAGVELDEKNIPENDRYAFVRPLQYALLAQYEDIKNHDIGTGSYSEGTTGKLNNIQVIKTNHLPRTNITQSVDATNPNNVYYGDFRNTACLVMNKNAVGTVSRQGLIVEPKWILERLAHLLTARILQGHGILRPDCAVEISAAAA